MSANSTRPTVEQAKDRIRPFFASRYGLERTVHSYRSTPEGPKVIERFTEHAAQVVFQASGVSTDKLADSDFLKIEGLDDEPDFRYPAETVLAAYADLTNSWQPVASAAAGVLWGTALNYEDILNGVKYH